MARKVELDANGYRKFGVRDLIAYACGDVGCCMSFSLKSYIAIFWTQYMGMDLWYAALLLVVQVWDAINDPLIGAVVDADRRTYKRNKFLHYMWLGSMGLIIGGALCFIPIPNAPAVVKGIVFVAGYMLWDAFYTLANVPYGSILGLITNDAGQRGSLSAWRSVGTMIGNMIPMVVFPFIIYDETDNILGERLFIAAIIMGILGFLAFQYMIRNTVFRVNAKVTVSEEKPKFNFLSALKNFVHNRPALGCSVALLGTWIGMGGVSTATTVLFQSYFHNAQITGIISLFSMLPIFLFTPFANKMVVKYGKKELSVVGTIIALVGGVLMLVLPMPANMDGIAMFMICQLLYTAGISVGFTATWGMMSDAIDYNEWKTGKREEGTIFALHSFFRKLGQSIAPSLALVIMTALGYVGTLGANQTPETAEAMKYVIAGLLSFSAVTAAIGYGLVYNLNREETERMTRELQERHAAR